MPWTRNSDCILKVEPTGFPGVQPGDIIHPDYHMMGGLESQSPGALAGPGENPFHGLAEFSYWEFISLSRLSVSSF